MIETASDDNILAAAECFKYGEYDETRTFVTGLLIGRVPQNSKAKFGSWGKHEQRSCSL
jgi:hypothetical protein